MNTITTKQARQLGIFIPKSYTRQKLFIHIVDSVTPHSWYWSGGSISYWAKIVNGTSYLLTNFPPFPYTTPADAIQLNDSLYVIQTGVFSGKQSMMSVYLHPSHNIAKAYREQLHPSV